MALSVSWRRPVHVATSVEVARLAGVSRDRATSVVAELEHLGLVERRRAGRAWLVSIVEGTPVVEALREIDDLRERTLEKLRHAATAIDPRPSWMALYGSWVHGTARVGSDLDVAVIAPPGDERDKFDAALEAWSSYAERVTGLGASLVVADDVDDARGPMWDTVRREGVLLEATRTGRARAHSGSKPPPVDPWALRRLSSKAGWCHFLRCD